MQAAVLSLHYEHSRGFVRSEEKSYLSKQRRKKVPLHPRLLLCQSVREVLGQLVVMCESCHVWYCKVAHGQVIIKVALSSLSQTSVALCLLAAERGETTPDK